MPTAALVLETHNLRGGAAARRTTASLSRLLERLKGQTYPLAELEALVITHSGLPVEAREALTRAAGRGIDWVELPGEADYYEAKNRGFDATGAQVVVFGDSDCWPDERWLASLLAPFSEPAAQAVAGRTCYRPDLFGIAATSIDFNYYPSPLGPSCTRNFYANNVAFRREVFAAHRYGGNEGFYRGNCQTLGLRLQAAGIPVRFVPEARTTHRFPDSVAEFVKLRMLRGGDLVALAPEVLGAYAPAAKRMPLPLASASVWAARTAFSAGALGRQDMPALGLRWPLAAAGMLGISILDAVGAAARCLRGPASPELGGTALSYHADVDGLSGAAVPEVAR